jgi:hypothetical protein
MQNESGAIARSFAVPEHRLNQQKQQQKKKIMMIKREKKESDKDRE